LCLAGAIWWVVVQLSLFVELLVVNNQVFLKHPSVLTVRDPESVQVSLRQTLRPFSMISALM
jgi:hypothetical protein